MRTIGLCHSSANLSAGLFVSAKIILALLFLLYAVFHFSTSHWIVLGLFAVGVMAIMQRISLMGSTHSNEITKANIVATDGGTFRQPESNKPVRNSGPVVYDGGIGKHKV